MKKTLIAVTSGALALALLAGCSNSQEEHSNSSTVTSSVQSTDHHHAMHMDGEVPESMKKAENAAYAPGQAVRITADHMPGMDGTIGTVGQGYSTVTYAVTYTPTDGSPKVVDHKWVVQEEIQGGRDHAHYADGDTVTLEADHMPGMKGATATIVSSTTQPVYTVNFTPEGSNQEITNHMWVTEDELQPVQ